jgi:hypothetical protein
VSVSAFDFFLSMLVSEGLFSAIPIVSRKVAGDCFPTESTMLVFFNSFSGAGRTPSVSFFKANAKPGKNTMAAQNALSGVVVRTD